MRNALIALVVLGASAALLMGLASSLGSWSSYTVACGGYYDAGVWVGLDGGAFIDAGAGVDGGPLILDGGPADSGPEVDQVVGGGAAHYVEVANPSTTLVYVGGSDVTPTNGYPICTTATSCRESGVELEAKRGAVYCTSAGAAHTVRVLQGGP